MPNVMGREFPYTPEGMAAAEDYRSSMGMRGGGMLGFRPVGYQEGTREGSLVGDDPSMDFTIYEDEKGGAQGWTHMYPNRPHGPELYDKYGQDLADRQWVEGPTGAYEALNPQNLERVEDTQTWNQRQFGDPPGETFSQDRYRGNWLLMNGDTPYPGDPTGGTTWSDFYRAYVRELGKEAADRIIDGQIEGSGGSIPYFNPSEQHNPFHNPNVAEVATGGLMSLARRRGYAG
jgi:hypothetical protein